MPRDLDAGASVPHLSAASAAAMLSKGRYRARLARSSNDIEDAQALRARCFSLKSAADRDPYDRASLHLLVEDRATGALVCCCRLLPLQAAQLEQSYAAQFYDLTALKAYGLPMMELGRFCVQPGRRDPDILRLAWAALAAQVDRRGVGMLFGCSSFAGIDLTAYGAAFGLLRARHLAPLQWRPGIRAGEAHPLCDKGQGEVDHIAALRQMPSLLRTYLSMGGWVSDHVVVDRQMNTLHVFTGLEISAIPAARKRLLRGLI